MSLYVSPIENNLAHNFKRKFAVNLSKSYHHIAKNKGYIPVCTQRPLFIYTYTNIYI